MTPRRAPVPVVEAKEPAAPLRAFLRYGEVRLIGPGTIVPAILVAHAPDYGAATALFEAESLRLASENTPFSRTPNNREIEADAWADAPGVASLTGRDVKGLSAEQVKARLTPQEG